MHVGCCRVSLLRLTLYNVGTYIHHLRATSLLIKYRFSRQGSNDYLYSYRCSMDACVQYSVTMRVRISRAVYRSRRRGKGPALVNDRGSAPGPRSVARFTSPLCACINALIYILIISYIACFQQLTASIEQYAFNCCVLILSDSTKYCR